MTIIPMPLSKKNISERQDQLLKSIHQLIKKIFGLAFEHSAEYHSKFLNMFKDGSKDNN